MQQLLKILFEEYYMDLYRYLLGLCHDVSLTEDLVSETFLEAVKSIVTFRGQSDVKTWLFSIGRHRWFAYLRKKKRQPEVQPYEWLCEVSVETPESQYITRETAERIQELIQEQPERTAGILQMRLEGYSFHEIAAKYGISESSARVIDFRAREKIRQILKKEGLYEE